MARTKSPKPQQSQDPGERRPDPFERRETDAEADEAVHRLGPGVICGTEARGYETPQGRSVLDLVVDASEGFIPLWARDLVLRWRFRERSLAQFARPAATKAEVRALLGEALLAWGSAAPVRFKEDQDLWDFEVVMRQSDECTASGCVMASSFFPDAGRHELQLFPKLFAQTRKEQVDTLIHESGHIFGLRHFFAKVSETAWPSEVFGTQSKFSIMNYGTLSELTQTDKDDLRRLYQAAWSGTLTRINGTPIRLVKPYSALARR